MKRTFEDNLFDESSVDQDTPAQKKKRTSRFEGAATSDAVDNGIPSSQNIQELLASTKKQIEERKRQSQALLAQQKLPAAGLLPTPNIPRMNVSVNPPLAAEQVLSSAMSEAVEKARKAAEVCEMLTRAKQNRSDAVRKIHVCNLRVANDSALA